MDDRILMTHGGGGTATQRLVAEHVLSRLANPLLSPLTDAAVLERPEGRICMTTDSFVVQPLEFPGGDIGRLAVCGTVNDLVVMGARPLGLGLALVLEEGLSLATLDRILDSLAAAAVEAGVSVVTGDTKVVERGRGDGMTITTSGVGVIPDGLDLGLARIEAGDAVIVTGGLAEHGLAIMSAREGLAFTTTLRSDAAPLGGLAQAILASGAALRFMRDPTRGGLAGVLCDVAEGTGLTVEVDEESLPVLPVVRHTAEALGLDPLTVANEGKLVVVVAGPDAGRALAACRAHAQGRSAAVVGRVTKASPPLVELLTVAGGRRVVQRPWGEDLPRIC